ncbi:MAG: hypothetical protein M1818_002468 [Claussenomyces sp. TS43310]|nr:MAG: hypothetical protein M1818_002468 [Claussenomyces sp. TS43310]
MSAVADSPFSHLVNFRDVGKTINDFAGKSSADRRQLREGYGIKTVMDLRTRSELEKQAKKRELSSDGLAQPAKIPGIDYLEINLNGPGFERSLLKRLSYWSYLYVLDCLAIFPSLSHGILHRIKGASKIERMQRVLSTSIQLMKTDS